MADTKYQPQTRTDAEVQIDQGLRSYMLKVYNYMGAGLAITGAAAYGTFQAAVDASGALTPFGQMIFVSPLKWVLILAPLAMVFLLSFRIEKMSVSAAQLTFWAYAALVRRWSGLLAYQFVVSASVREDSTGAAASRSQAL